MTKEQRTDLERIMGGSVQLIPYTETVHDIQELVPAFAAADAIAAVLPPELLALLLPLAGNRPVLQAISRRVHTGRTVLSANGTPEKEFVFVHCGWQQIIRLELETIML